MRSYGVQDHGRIAHRLAVVFFNHEEIQGRTGFVVLVLLCVNRADERNGYQDCCEDSFPCCFHGSESSQQLHTGYSNECYERKREGKALRLYLSLGFALGTGAPGCELDQVCSNTGSVVPRYPVLLEIVSQNRDHAKSF